MFPLKTRILQEMRIGSPKDFGVRYQAPSKTPDLAIDVNRKPGKPLSGSSGPDTRIVKFLHACSPFRTLTSVIDADYEWMGVVNRKDWGKLIPRASWHIAGRERLILISGIGSPWEPGGTLCSLGVPLGGALSHCEISHWKAKGSSAPLCDLRTCFVCWWDEDGHVRSVVGDSPEVLSGVYAAQM